MQEMTNKELDEFVAVTEGPFVGSMYKINNANFVDADGGGYYLELDFDVMNLDKGKEADFEKWLGEFVLRALNYAIENDPNNGNGV